MPEINCTESNLTRSIYNANFKPSVKFLALFLENAVEHYGVGSCPVVYALSDIVSATGMDKVTIRQAYMALWREGFTDDSVHIYDDIPEECEYEEPNNINL